MDNVPVLGKLIEGTAFRDAVHIAVAPVTAGEGLDPGERVVLVNGQAMLCLSMEEDAVGIVDPFLKRPVETGQRFYLFLYPRTITSLRHVWSHPAFVNKVPAVTMPKEVDGITDTTYDSGADLRNVK